jgi:hypothetical protein
MSDKAPPTARRAGLARHLALDDNPLRRRIDRLETCIMAGLLAAFLAGAPLVAIAAGSWAHAGDLREQHAQRYWHQVPAVLLQAAPRPTTFRHRSSWTAWVRARWTPPGRQARVGEIPAPPGSRAGSRQLVWADRAGPVAGVPLTHDEITARMIAVEMLAPVGLAIVVIGLARVARWLLDRRRLVAWEVAWTSIGPGWTRRRQRRGRDRSPAQ